MSAKTTYKIIWETEDDSGELPILYGTLGEATDAAREWEAEMMSTEKPERPRQYRWEVIRTHPPLPRLRAH